MKSKRTPQVKIKGKCACGCGEKCSRKRRYAPGHNQYSFSIGQRAAHMWLHR